MKTAKITFKLVRSFGLGFTILSPTLNGVCFHVDVACFSVMFWSRGTTLFSANNHWRG